MLGFPKAPVTGVVSGESQQILDFLNMHTSSTVLTAEGLMCQVVVTALEVQVTIFEPCYQQCSGRHTFKIKVDFYFIFFLGILMLLSFAT